MITDPSFKQKQLTDKQREQLLDRLDEQDAATCARDKRQNTRLQFRRVNVPIRITQPAGGTLDCRVATRNLSSTGLSFLYGSFLHLGTQVRVNLSRRLGGTDSVDGKVAWCRHVVGPHHIIGIRFKQKVFAKLYINPQDCGALDGEYRVDPSSIKGKVLSIDDQPMDQMLLKHHLKPTKIELIAATSEGEALQAVRSQSPDIALMELNIGMLRGEELLTRLASQGFDKPVIAVTAEHSPIRLAAAHAAGVVAVVAKPFDPARLLGALSLWLGGASGNVEDALYSELPASAGMGDLVLQYIESTRQSLTKLQSAIRRDELDTVRSLCQSLKGSGASFGFPALSEAAKETVRTLDTTMSLAESIVELQQLESICRRITPRPIE